jgi:uncharacterized membrane protein YuzA (DUF378 family)
MRSKRKKEVGMLEKILIALGALWAMGFLTFHFVRLLLGRKVF